jgi:hypothetical protein
VDGNKSTAMYAAYLLETLGHVLETEHKEFEDFAMIIIYRTIEPESTALWFDKHTHGT